MRRPFRTQFKSQYSFRDPTINRLKEHLQTKLGSPLSFDTDTDVETVTIHHATPRVHPELVMVIPLSLIDAIKGKPSAIEELANKIADRWTSMRPEIFLDPATNRFGVRTPHKPDFINELKAFIPAGARTWEGNTKTWYVNSAYIDVLERLGRKYFPDIVVTTPNAEAIETAAEASDVYGRLVAKLPDHALKAVYRAIALSCHPDKAKEYGLSAEEATRIMMQVNGVWAEIKKAKGWS